MVGRLIRRLTGRPVPEPFESRIILTPARAAQTLARYAAGRHAVDRLSYATVADYCDSVDHLPELTGRQGDLKDVQRPWALKTLVSLLPPGAQLVEIGAGLPDVAQALIDCGYRAVAVDPYEGAGNGPTEYEAYCRHFPRVDIRRQLFDESLDLAPQSIDAVYSISTLEHIADLGPVFRAIRKFLKPGGLSVHCIDVVTRGMDDAYHLNQAKQLLRFQGEPDGAWDPLLERANQDLETYFLGPSGHQTLARRHAVPRFSIPKSPLSADLCPNLRPFIAQPVTSPSSNLYGAAIVAA